MRDRIKSRLEKLERGKRYALDVVWEAAFAEMTDEELRAIISGVEKTNGNEALLDDPAWREANLTEFEKAAIHKFAERQVRYMEATNAKWT